MRLRSMAEGGELMIGLERVRSTNREPGNAHESRDRHEKQAPRQGQDLSEGLHNEQTKNKQMSAAEVCSSALRTAMIGAGVGLAVGVVNGVVKSKNNEIKNYILSNFSLPFTPKKLDLLPFLMNDKKNKVGKINFSLLTNIGSCSVDNLFSTDEL